MMGISIGRSKSCQQFRMEKRRPVAMAARAAHLAIVPSSPSFKDAVCGPGYHSYTLHIDHLYK